MKKVFLSLNSTQTQKIAGKLIQNISCKKDQACIIAITGDLGSGKTTFIQGLAKELGIKEKILSPTFIIMKKFQITHPQLHSEVYLRHSTNPKRQILKFKTLYHFDCYRIEHPQEILALGFKKIISAGNNIVVIEWPEKIKEVLPQNIVVIEFIDFLKYLRFSKNLRKIKITME
jgi:tRNA threonylcarbamoyladenosine biosynthesis protein TsaE